MQIPTQNGDQFFYLAKGTVFTILLSLTALPISLGGGWYLYQKQNGESQSLQSQVAHLTAEKQQLEMEYQEQLDVNHSLSQSLTEKSNQIQLLGKRVFDVESVLGLADEELLIDEANLEKPHRCRGGRLSGARDHVPPIAE